MAFLKYIQIAILVGLPVLCMAQDEESKRISKPQSSAADCPSWGTKKQNTRGDFLEYLRNAQGKKVNTNDPYLANAKMLSNSTKPVKDVELKSASKNNFYTQRRYNLFPDHSVQAKNETLKHHDAIPAGSTTYEPLPQNEDEVLKKVVSAPITKSNQKLISKDENTEEISKSISIALQEQKNSVKEVETVHEANSQEHDNTTKENGATTIKSSKSNTSWFKKKCVRLFSKKNNKPAKPNYEKCTTRF